MSKDHQSRRILRLPEVIAKTGLSRSTIYAYSCAGFFPERIQVGIRAVGWSEAEVDQWIQERKGE